MRAKVSSPETRRSIDVNGVGQLIDMGVKKGRASRQAKAGQHLKVGICGEHGGAPTASDSATASAWTT